MFLKVLGSDGYVDVPLHGSQMHVVQSPDMSGLWIVRVVNGIGEWDIYMSEIRESALSFMRAIAARANHPAAREIFEP